MAGQKHLEKRALTKVAVFGLLTVVSIALSVYGLMLNSRGAVERFETLKSVDEAGGDVETALNDLRSYIYRHMNSRVGSDLGIKPPIQLKFTYERLVAAEEERVSKTNEALNPEAIAYCEATNPVGLSGRHRIDCIEKYVDEKGAKSQVISDDLYKFDFVPPRWSPDLAGFSIVASVIFGVLFAVHVYLYYRARSDVHYAN